MLKSRFKKNCNKFKIGVTKCITKSDFTPKLTLDHRNKFLCGDDMVLKLKPTLIIIQFGKIESF